MERLHRTLNDQFVKECFSSSIHGTIFIIGAHRDHYHIIHNCFYNSGKCRCSRLIGQFGVGTSTSTTETILLYISEKKKEQLCTMRSMVTTGQRIYKLETFLNDVLEPLLFGFTSEYFNKTDRTLTNTDQSVYMSNKPDKINFRTKLLT